MNWRVAIALALAATVAALPFTMLVPSLIGGQGSSLLGAIMVQATLFTVAALAGTLTGPAGKLGAPVLDAWFEGKRVDLRPVAWSAVAGGILGLAATAFVLVRYAPSEAAAAGQDVALPGWAGVALALYGGFGEEVLYRFGMMSVLVWAIANLRRLVHSWNVAPSESLPAWGGIIIGALIFGLIHTGYGPGSAVEQVGLRVGTGIFFGWLYWRRGIESAIAAHLVYDLVFIHAVIAVA